MIAPGPDGTPPVKVWRGAQAQKLRAEYESKGRIIPSRWHRKWKDKGNDFDNGLNDPAVPKHMCAKSRCIIQGFRGLDIAVLNRSVPTPATSDVPLCIQVLASLRANIWSADLKGAFTQGLRGQRPDPLFASPPEGGIP